jgi:myo-inositol-1-phosphate synthase
MAVGLWLVGARGSLATTVTTGLSLLSQHAASSHGLVSELPVFGDVELPGYDEIVVGGHDVVDVSLRKRAESLVSGGVLPQTALALTDSTLGEADGRIRFGIGDGENARQSITRVQRDLEEFRQANNLETVIVVNVSSTEAVVEPHLAHDSLQALDVALDAGEAVLPPSSLYAYAALDAGFPFVDFTPSLGASIAALDQLARARRVAYAGRDGKTGETLLKAVLAPMFVQRNLRVTSWAGLNLLGGGDGRSLAEDDRKSAKLTSKARSLREGLGYEVDAPVGIEYVEDMNEWKTAWNQVRFQGFLGTPMTLQLTWQGCDSALAAPLVIDLVRFVALAQRSGEVGALDALAFFFKDPLGGDEHGLVRQFDRLTEWATALEPLT